MFTSRLSQTSSDPTLPSLAASSEALPAADMGYRWVVMCGIFCASMISVVDRIAWGNVSTFYAQTMGVSVTALGSFFSAFYVGYLITNALSGFASDMFGGRRMITLALLLLGLSTFAFGLTTSVTVGLIIQCAMGLVAGMDFSACVRLLSDVFPPEKKSTAMGIFLASIPVGVMLPNLFIPTLLKTYGWQGVYHTLGVATVAMGVIVYCILGRKSDVYAKRVGSSPHSLRDLLGNRGFRIAAIAGFGQQWGIWGFAFWANALLIKGHHIDPVRAGFIVALFGGVGIVAKPVAGWLADHIRFSKPVFGAVMCLLFGVSLIVFARLSTVAAFTVFSALVGLFAAGAGVVVATLAIETAGPKLSGSASGLANALWILGNVMVPLVVGAVFQYLHSFQLAVLAIAAGPIFSTVCFIHLARLGLVQTRR